MIEIYKTILYTQVSICTIFVTVRVQGDQHLSFLSSAINVGIHLILTSPQSYHFAQKYFLNACPPAPKNFSYYKMFGRIKKQRV